MNRSHRSLVIVFLLAFVLRISELWFILPSWVRKALGDRPTWVPIHISLKESDKESAPTACCKPNLYSTANINSLNHALPNLVSHNSNSGCRFLHDWACRCLWTLLLGRLISFPRSRRLCLPVMITLPMRARLVVWIACVVVFFYHWFIIHEIPHPVPIGLHFVAL